MGIPAGKRVTALVALTLATALVSVPADAQRRGSSRHYCDARAHDIASTAARRTSGGGALGGAARGAVGGAIIGEIASGNAGEGAAAGAAIGAIAGGVRRSNDYDRIYRQEFERCMRRRR
jgi:uncharacterized protein YcfJ